MVKQYLRFEKNGNVYLVFYGNNSYPIAELIRLEDGFFNLFIGGDRAVRCWADYVVKEISDKLIVLNRQVYNELYGEDNGQTN